MEQRRIAEAVGCYRRTQQIKPGSPEIHSNLLFCLDHDDETDAAALFFEHCRFGEQFEAPLRSAWPQHGNARDPDRRLKIGFVSGDFRDHAVTHFIEPVLARLAHDPTLSLHAYANHAIDDEVTQRLKKHFVFWHHVVHLSDLAFAEKIRADSIDILLDLSGHTANGRLPALARKPAPLQVGWIGYPGTTGLQAMDYSFKNHWVAPVGMLDDQYLEKLIRMPAHTAYEPHPQAPEVNALPAFAKGYVTFGSFNRVIKISKRAIDLWAKVLHAVPASRMLLGSVSGDQVEEKLRADFSALGIDPDRLIFRPQVDMKAYLAMHGEIDILLDTVPYCGSTTTRHALWMGVPLVTLSGPRPAQRQGAGALGPIGLQNWIAQTPGEFVAIAEAAAANLPELALLRSALRGKMIDSEFNQPKLAAQCIAAALRFIWKRWCAGLPAESFILEGAGIGDAEPIG